MDILANLNPSKACLIFLSVFVYLQDPTSKWTSALEYLVVGISPLNISVSGFHICKLAVSFVIFLAEVSRFQFPPGRVLKLWYLQGTWKSPCKSVSCNALISDGATVYHSTLSNSRRSATAYERLFELVPMVHDLNFHELRQKMLLTTCVGLIIQNPDTEILRKLENCGKCHDWASAAVFSLSIHKYISYSCVLVFRCLTWYIIALAIYELIRERMYSGGFFVTLCNILHTFLIAFDISNFQTEQLEMNYLQTQSLLPWRGKLSDVLKSIILFISCVIYSSFVSHDLSKYDLFLYFFFCFTVCLSVHFYISRLHLD